MSETYQGVAVVWGIDSTIDTSASDVDSDWNVTGVAFPFSEQTFATEGEKREIPDSKGSAKGVVYYDGRKTLSITVFPTANTLAKAKAAQIVPPRGSTIKIDADDSDMAGDWLLDRAQKNKTRDGEMTIQMDLIQYADANIQTTIT